ncbi:MAG: DMT family protein [Limisphaerales bacterium]
MSDLTQSRWAPIALLVASNVFMTFAWYGHLKFKSAPLWVVVLASWGIAFFEYCLMVPANRWGHGAYSATQLKIMQEVITILVFCAFAVLYLGEKLKWNHFAAFACVIAAVFFVRLDSTDSSTSLPKSPIAESPSPKQP